MALHAKITQMMHRMKTDLYERESIIEIILLYGVICKPLR